MDDRDLMAALHVAEHMLRGQNDQQAFADSVVRARDVTAAEMPDDPLYALASALASFGRSVRGDVQSIPSVQS